MASFEKDFQLIAVYQCHIIRFQNFVFVYKYLDLLSTFMMCEDVNPPQESSSSVDNNSL